MEIKQSTDYSKFKTINGNRNISEKKVLNIISDIEAGLNLLPYCPILIYVGKDNTQPFNIIDGQHRKEVSERTKSPVYYVESEKLDLRQIARLNSRSDKWTNKNFLDCYVNLGIEDYIILRDFIKKHHLIYSAAVSLLMVGKAIASSGGEIMEKFRNGEFEVNHLDLAEEIVSLTTGLFEIYTFYNDRNLIAAMQELKTKGKCDFDILRKKLKAAKNEMNRQNSKKEYIYNIERVYNYNNKHRETIF